MLRVASLSAGYGTVPVVNGVTLQIGENEYVGLLGRNGVGKTTLLRSIIGLLRPFGGSVQFGGAAIAGLPPHAIAKRGIAYVPQGRGIFPKLTVKENLTVGTRAAGRAAHIDERVFSFFPVLRNRLGQLGGTLSGGEQQMLAIARALCGKPKLLLLDEPSEGIQPSIVKQLEELLPEVGRQAGLSILIVEQNLDLATQVGQRFVFMDKGRIVHECGRADMDDKQMVHDYLAI